MKKLLTISLALVFLLSACQVKSIRQGNLSKNKAWNSYVHYFSGHSSRLLFKASLDIAKEHFSGLLVVKQMTSGEYRSIFTTETGFKVFDFTIMDSTHVVNYAVGPLQKKFIADRLAYTVQVMLLRHFNAPCLVSSGIQAYPIGYYVYELHKKDRDITNLDDSGQNIVTHQTVYVKNKKKAEAVFYGFGQGSAPDSSSVTHTGFPLQATFRWLKD